MDRLTEGRFTHLMQLLRTGSLILATLMVGLSTGVILLFANTIMPGLSHTDDRTFVGAYQAIDRAIENPLFLLTFMGAFVFAGLAAVLSFSGPWRQNLPWLIAAAALYLIVLIITFAVHLPLNDAIKNAGDPAKIDVAAVRAAFNEAKWVQWNIVRSVASLGAFVCLVWTLVRR